MVFKYGMGPSGLIGNFDALAYSAGSTRENDYLSDEIKHRIDTDVQEILSTCQKDIEEILRQEPELIEYFAQELLKKGELEYDEIVEIFKKHGKERFQNSSG